MLHSSRLRKERSSAFAVQDFTQLYLAQQDWTPWSEP